MAIQRGMSTFSWYLLFLVLPYSLFQKQLYTKKIDILSNWSRLLNWKVRGTSLQSSKLFKRFLKNIALPYIYQLTKFGGLISCGSKYIFKNALSCTITHHNVIDLVNHMMIENTKFWVSQEWNITFLWNKKILNWCFKWNILRSYIYVAEVTFNL